MKPFPWKCGTCRELEVRPETLVSYQAEMNHDGRAYQVEVADFQVLRCSHCSAIMLDEEAEERLSNALRAEIGLLLPSEIREGRESLGLKQKEMANLLEISEFTQSRWETGAQIQQRCMDRFLRAFFALSTLRDFLSRDANWGNIREIPHFLEPKPVIQPAISRQVSVFEWAKIGTGTWFLAKDFATKVAKQDVEWHPTSSGATEKTPGLRKTA